MIVQAIQPVNNIQQEFVIITRHWYMDGMQEQGDAQESGEMKNDGRLYRL